MNTIETSLTTTGEIDEDLWKIDDNHWETKVAVARLEY